MHRNLKVPQLLRFGRVKSRPTKLKPHKSDRKEMKKDSDTDDELDTMHLNKTDMDQVTCFRCGKNGHFARDCKEKRSAPVTSSYASHKKARFTKNNTAFIQLKKWHDIVQMKGDIPTMMTARIRPASHQMTDQNLRTNRTASCIWNQLPTMNI